MSEQPRLVATKEYRRKSLIAIMVGSVNVFTALFILIVVGVSGLYFLLFLMLMPKVQADRAATVERIENRLDELVQEYNDAANQAEKDRIAKEIRTQQQVLEYQNSVVVPASLSDVTEEVGIGGFVPFTRIALASMGVLGLLLLATSVGLLFRFRWSRRALIGVCAGILIWISIVGPAFLLFYNRILARTLTQTGTWPSSMSKEILAEIQSLMVEIQVFNLQINEVMGGLLALFYFGLMIYLMKRPEVVQDLSFRPPKDLMDWEHLSEGGKISGESE